MKLSELSNSELGAMCRSRYQRLAQAHSDGLTDVHPLDTWREQSATLRSAKAQDEENSGIGPRNLQRSANGKQIKSGADGDEPKTGPRGKQDEPAKDSALLAAVQDDFIRRDGSADIAGQLNLAAARRVDPARVSAMGAAIKGYDRLKRR